MPVHLQEIEEDHHRNHDDAEEVRASPRCPRWKTTTESRTKKLLCILVKCIVMGFVFSLFILFISFAALVLIHFVLISAAGRRRRRDGRFQQDPELSTDSTIRSSYSREDLQQLLPHLCYMESPHTSIDCAICLESVEDGDFCRELPDCKHLFHANCIDNWLTKVPNCPICRTRVQLDSGASGSVHRDDEWKVWWPVALEDGNVPI